MFKRGRPLLLFAAGGILGSLVLLWPGVKTVAQVQDPTPPPPEQVVNPHWYPDRCANCHEGQDSFVGIAPVQIESLCLDCHNGQDALAENHPIGPVAENRREDIPSGWPLVGDRLTCLTCHDIKMACDKQAVRPAGNGVFLRAPWSKKSDDFCAHCHDPESYPEISPHVMMSLSDQINWLGKKNEVVESACLFCHTEVPDRNAMKRTDDAKLRTTEIVLCRSCHRMHRTFYDPGHIGDKISTEILIYMRARELLGPDVTPSRRFLDRLERENAHPVKMVPDKDGRMTCTTCHNPHQEGVFPPESDLAFEPMWLIGPRRLASPSASEESCRNCHLK